MQADFEPSSSARSPPDQRRWRLAICQRDIIWCASAREPDAKGFTIRLGEILHAKLPALPGHRRQGAGDALPSKEVEARLAEARRVYRERNLRLDR